VGSSAKPDLGDRAPGADGGRKAVLWRTADLSFPAAPFYHAPSIRFAGEGRRDPDQRRGPDAANGAAESGAAYATRASASGEDAGRDRPRLQDSRGDLPARFPSVEQLATAGAIQ